jgi:hypothetical protein
MKFRTFLISCVTTAALSFPALARTSSDHVQLQAIATNSMYTEYDAGRLWSYSKDNLDWMAQGNQLMRLRDDLNTLGREVHQLQAENTLAPGEQKLVQQVAQTVTLMAVDAQDAILFGRIHRDDLFSPSYQKDVSQLYSNAEHLNREAHRVL